MLALKNVTYLIFCVTLLASPALYAEHHVYKSSYYSSSSSIPTPIKNLKIYKEDNKTSAVVGEITKTQNFTGSPSPWVKVTSADGKVVGWAHVDDIEDHLSSLQNNAYLIETTRSPGKYNVKKVSPEEQKERYEKARRRAKAAWMQQKSFAEAFLSPFFDDDYDSDTKDKALEKRVDDLDKKVDALEKKKGN